MLALGIIIGLFSIMTIVDNIVIYKQRKIIKTLFAACDSYQKACKNYFESSQAKTELVLEYKKAIEAYEERYQHDSTYINTLLKSVNKVE